MNRSPRRTALLATLALAAGGCAGAPARPAAGLAAEAGLPAALEAVTTTPGAPTLEPREVVPAPAAPAATSLDAAPAAPALRAARADRRHEPSAPAVARLDAGREAPAEEAAGPRAEVLAAARRMLGTRPRLDCSGFVLAALAEAGVAPELRPARSRSESLYRASRLVTRPSPGDLVFFHDTHDRDRRGRRAERNRFTHVALVEAVDGTALTLIHRGGKRVERIRMDLSRPSDPAANDPVRLRRGRDRPGTRYLSGELFAAFGGLLPDDVTRKLQARRGRDTPVRHPASR